MIRHLCSKPVVTVPETATVRDAARLMREKNVGALVVRGADRPGGILTDRDITVAVVAEGKDPATVLVSDVMHRNPAVVHEDDGVFEALRQFNAKGIRRLPVVNKTGKLTGMIALDDMLMLLGNEMAQVASTLSRELGRPPVATV